MLQKKIRLLCITCHRTDIGYEEQVELACLGGADMIQFRDKQLSDSDLFNTSIKLKQICNKYNVYFTINNRIDIADISNSDGVHIGQNDLPFEYARKILGNEKIIGLSASNYEEAINTDKLDIDYIGYGAIFSTQTKPESKASGLDILNKVKQNCKKPIIAIGGINEKNVYDVIKAGADGVAIVSAICGAKNIKAQAKKIKEIILKNSL